MNANVSKMRKLLGHDPEERMQRTMGHRQQR